MSRQTFITNSFFANASEESVRFVVLSLPQKTAEIKLVSENRKLNSIRLQCLHAEQEAYQVDISLLFLSNEYTQVNLHVAYIDGHTFNHDNKIKQAMLNFESFLQAAVNGEHTFYRQIAKEQKASANFLHAIEVAIASITGLAVWKKV